MNVRQHVFGLLIGLLASSSSASWSLAQSRGRLDGGGLIEVGGEEERYLRALQVAGLAPLEPWSIQPFSSSQQRRLRGQAVGMWQTHYDSETVAYANLLRPHVRVIDNSTFPLQVGGGPTWAGRGLTTEAQAGVTGAAGPIHVQLAPLAFWTQNLAFTMAPNGEQGAARFGDPRFPLNIDAPQRFGDAAYARFTMGTSRASLDIAGMTAGVSTAPQRWGPARDYPLVIGPNAGGFPDAFVGTSEPVDVWLAKFHARVIYGRLGQSAYSPIVADTRFRLGSGFVFVVMPRGMSGLELGATRFIHRPWDGLPDGAELVRPFSAIFSNNKPGARTNDTLENQNASLFARWTLPSAGFEVYAELYREDYPGAFHIAASTLVEKPDDLASFTIGVQQVVKKSPASLWLLRAELVNGETSHQERGQRGFAEPSPPYVHANELQGHTVDGLILGSPEAYGGAAWRLGIDAFSSSGRRSVGLERSLRFDWLPGVVAGAAPAHPDIIYALRVEMMTFHRRADLGFTVIPAVDLNRNMVANHDVFNLTTALTLSGWP